MNFDGNLDVVFYSWKAKHLERKWWWLVVFMADNDGDTDVCRFFLVCFT